MRFILLIAIIGFVTAGNVVVTDAYTDELCTGDVLVSAWADVSAFGVTGD